jgi:hypothetical protein
MGRKSNYEVSDSDTISIIADKGGQEFIREDWLTTLPAMPEDKKMLEGS